MRPQMVDNLQARSHVQETVLLKPCPDGHPDHRLIQADDETTGHLDLPSGSLLHIDLRRRPRDGDVVLAELVLRQRLTRTVRRYTSIEGIVGLTRLGARAGSILRPHYEVGILGVVDGHIVPLDGSQPDVS